jgi:hypothetical protein
MIMSYLLFIVPAIKLRYNKKQIKKKKKNFFSQKLKNILNILKYH